MRMRMPANRVLVNTPAPQGSTGITTNVFPSMTLGCGAVAGNITRDNVGPQHLINIKRLAYVVRKPEEAFEMPAGGAGYTRNRNRNPRSLVARSSAQSSDTWPAAVFGRRARARGRCGLGRGRSISSEARRRSAFQTCRHRIACAQTLASASAATRAEIVDFVCENESARP